MKLIKFVVVAITLNMIDLLMLATASVAPIALGFAIWSIKVHVFEFNNRTCVVDAFLLTFAPLSIFILSPSRIKNTVGRLKNRILVAKEAVENHCWLEVLRIYRLIRKTERDAFFRVMANFGYLENWNDYSYFARRIESGMSASVRSSWRCTYVKVQGNKALGIITLLQKIGLEGIHWEF